MDTIDTISSIQSPAIGLPGLNGTTANSDRAELQRDDFYKIMISELSNQDPFEPMDNRQFLEQLTSLQSLDAIGRLNDGIETLILQNQMSSASGLIGRDVLAKRFVVDADGAATFQEISGKVEKVLIQGGEVHLLLEDDETVKLTEVGEIS